ncbi:MAG: 16S rRNA (adenine(1518)-N(6)/adenine(1519)-N(6))-dimethyltransferase RsmA [Bacteroidales bacterium]|nr:16S rRNA (adenine(1518)-N(6)/adenine(1519)-N(6))-dimethyltransferase RsmA [Bacteroidales bacterium]MBR6844924.1 16S rRNA (adenine(1518)-N(6)/adenine(1519)-N(6))-dimethyltransferase RsmA [Bacteroidales bacterium]
MNEVKAKKFLGQHFLTDENIAQRIVDSLSGSTPNVIEIGPGMGVLTKYLIGKQELNFHVVEIDRESVAWLHEHYPTLDVIEGDFLKLDLNTLFQDTFTVIGNFPYNISSQILFRIFDCRNQAVEVVGMFQKEVAERVAAGPGSKTYGILSVLLSAFYDIEYLFTVHEHVFNPPPKVKSAVIRLTRNDVTSLECDEKLFVQTVKAGFNQRRKTLRNALRSAGLPIEKVDETVLGKRAEQLSVQEFIQLTKSIQSCL